MRKSRKPTAPADPHGLTVSQQNAVDLLVTGKNDAETADLVKVNRVTVTRWRLYSPQFRAALADRRAAIWGAAADRLRAIIPKALDALAKALEDDHHRVPVALALLKLAGPLPLVPTDPTDPESYVVEQVERERSQQRTTAEEARDRMDGRLAYSRHRDSVRELLAALSPAEPESSARPALPAPAPPAA